MALYQIKISYDGTDFHGYQRQLEHRTVQNEIELALRNIGWTGRSILSSGRTDTGVHAVGQIAVFNFEWKHSEIELKKAINANLPNDVSVVDLVMEKNETFSPRFDAKSRIYRYQIYMSDVKIPTLERYTWRVWPKPDIRGLKEIADIFVGHHDFQKFGRPYLDGGRTERIVNSAKWIENAENQLVFRIEANSFLYHMVRRIVYINILVGQGKSTLQNVANELKGIGNLPPGIAPAKGLFLEEIKY